MELVEDDSRRGGLSYRPVVEDERISPRSLVRVFAGSSEGGLTELLLWKTGILGMRVDEGRLTLRFGSFAWQASGSPRRRTSRLVWRGDANLVTAACLLSSANFRTITARPRVG